VAAHRADAPQQIALGLGQVLEPAALVRLDVRGHD
jgi:hypothetical protein